MVEVYHLERHVWAWVIGGVFSLSACLLSAHTIIQTWRFNSIPDIRRNVIRVLLMCPVYAIEAWLGLLLKEETFIFDVLRECYEAMAIWAFYSFLIAFLGGEASAQQLLSNKQKEAHHMTPFKYCLSPWSVADDTFIRKTKYGVLQYVPLRLLTALGSFIAQWTGVYGEGEFDPEVAYPWLTLITNCSQIWAMYCLVLLYHASIEYIAPIKPFIKFCCVKAVVFFTFWQSVVIAGLSYLGKINATQTYTTDDISAGIQDFIICIEMFVAAIAHAYAFPTREFHDETALTPELGSITSVFSPADVISDVRAMGKHAAKEVHSGVSNAVDRAVDRVRGGWGLNANQKLMATVARQRSESKLQQHGALPGTPGKTLPSRAVSIGFDRSAAPSPLAPPPLIPAGTIASDHQGAAPTLVIGDSTAVIHGGDGGSMRGPAIAGGFDSLPASPVHLITTATAAAASGAGNGDPAHGGGSGAGPAVGEWRAL